jgi:protein phosphatase
MLQAAVRTASQSIFEQAHTSQQREGMGATCACAFITGNRLYTVSVGDSRIYLLSGAKLQQLTTAHTWIHEAIAWGSLNPKKRPGTPTRMSSASFSAHLTASR